MDQANSHRGSHTNSDLGPDLPKDLPARRSKEDVYPSRPSSRLGFNRTILSTSPPEAPPDSDVVQWSHSLFQNVGISDLRLSAVKPQPPTKFSMVDPPPPGCQVEDVTNEALFPSRSENPTNPGCGNGPSAFARSQAVPRKSPKSSAPSVSRLCFPFVTTPSPRRNKPSPLPPPPRHKYSCFPSLMSPVSPGRPAPRHQRHNYHQHGYSRSALLQVKWFWSLREEEWQGHDLQTGSTAAYGCNPPHGNVTFPPPLPPSTIGLGASVILNPLNATTVFPRFGDVKALRDPYCVQVDQYFFALSPWTICKILWIFDVLQANEKRSIKPRIIFEEDPSEADSENELETSSASTSFGDDSDTTLVESESETDLPQLSTSAVKIVSQAKIDDEARFAGPSSINFSALCTILENETWLQTIKFIASKSRPSDDTKAQWAINWYQRWAILLELSRHNKDRGHILFNLNTSCLGPSLPAKTDIPSRRFFLAGKTIDSEDEDA